LSFSSLSGFSGSNSGVVVVAPVLSVTVLVVEVVVGAVEVEDVEVLVVAVLLVELEVVSVVVDAVVASSSPQPAARAAQVSAQAKAVRALSGPLRPWPPGAARSGGSR
jgi:hypothetical protein